MKFWERVGIAIMSAWGLFAIHQGVSALVRMHNWVGLTPSDWGTWAGAVGTIAAVLASFFLFQRQREHEVHQARDDELRRRLLAMQTVSDVAYRALDAIKKVAEVVECKFPPGIVPNMAPRIPELRAILDRFAEPTADRIVVLVALTFSTALVETQDDIRVQGHEMEDYVLTRVYERIADLSAMHDRLIDQLIRLEEKCRAHGIDVEYDETVIAGE
jgi:ribosomal protein S10